MKIITYATASAECPPNAQALARIQCAMVGRGGATVVGWHPVLITGSTEAEARRKAQAWWDAEVARFAALSEPKRKSLRMEAAVGEAVAVVFDAAPAAEEAEEAV